MADVVEMADRAQCVHCDGTGGPADEICIECMGTGRQMDNREWLNRHQDWLNRQAQATEVAR
jgi:DnaJ-class molecular chaperone